MTRQDAQRIFDGLSKDDLLTLGRIYQTFLNAQKRTGTSIAKDAVLAVLPKTTDAVIYGKWVPALKIQGMEHTAFNGSFRVY